MLDPDADRQPAARRASTTRAPVGDGIVSLIVSAAIFGFVGFGFTWAHERTTTGDLVWAVALLKWTLRAGAVAFVAAAALVAARRWHAGELLGAAVGAGSAVVFVVVAVWDWLTPSLTSGVHPVILGVLALWNGWAAFGTLRALLQSAPRTHA